AYIRNIHSFPTRRSSDLMGNYSEYRTRKRPIVLEIPSPQVKSVDKRVSNKTRSARSPSRLGDKKSAKIKIRTVEDVERDIEKARSEEHTSELQSRVELVC